ncbi:MAG: hypothetical protein WDO24_24775 [Pseudomonadota bacterium]
MTEAPAFRYIARKRRPKEDRRFITGNGHYVADIALPGMKHVALVTSPHPARASFRSPRARRSPCRARSRC